MKVTYVYHSCYVVEFNEVVFIFDYFKGKLPDFDSKKKVIFLASHKHQDHFSLDIFKFSEKYENVTYILSNDIKLSDNYLLRHKINPSIKEKIIRIGKRTSKEVNIGTKCFEIETLRSTDEGVAFLIHFEDKRIYHAGDLNWWSWSGITDEENDKMANAYVEEINRLSSTQIDIAFVVLDPRQEDRYWWGLDYFLKTVDSKVIFPMHCWENYRIIDQFKKEREAEGYNSIIVNINQEGDSFEL